MNTIPVLVLVALSTHAVMSNGNGISLPAAEFSLDLLKALPSSTRDAMFSPLSIYALLAVLQQGATGATRAQLNNVLHAQPHVTRDGMRNLTASIEEADSVSSLRFMWKSRIKGNHNFKPEFQQVLRQDVKPRYRAGKANSANKPKNPPLRGILSKIVVPSKSSANTFAALANLLYLNGHWAHEALMPGRMRFKPAPGEEISAHALLMNKTCFSGVSHEAGARWTHVPIAVQKKSTAKIGVMPRGPYWSRRSLSLLVLVPTQPHALDQMVHKLSPQVLVGIFNYSSPGDRKDLALTLPTFFFNVSSNFKPVLKKLGLRSMFQSGPGLADISTEEQLFVSKVTQKGPLYVDEFGARTQEETSINFPYHYHAPWGETEVQSVDEPFLFFLVDRTNLLPLFAGKVSRPSPHRWSPHRQDDQFPQY